MRYFYLDKLQNKIYCFAPQTKKDMERVSPGHTAYMAANLVRITKEQAKKAAKDKTSVVTLQALEELNMPCKDMRLGLAHVNKLEVPAQI